MPKVLSHPDSPEEIEVADSAVQRYLAQGWQVVDKKPPARSKGGTNAARRRTQLPERGKK